MTSSCVAMIDMGLQGGPYWNVPTGRRDGFISRAADPLRSLPAPFHNLTTQLTLFGNVGLDANDLVLLVGMLNTSCMIKVCIRLVEKTFSIFFHF